MKQGWKIKKLGEVFSLEYGKSLDTKERCKDGIYPVYGANGVISRCNAYYYGEQSIIIGRKGTAGAVNITEDKFYPLDVTYYVVFDKSRYDLKYLYYLFLCLNLPLLAKGVKPGINRNDVYSIKKEFPPFSEQKRIVEILDSAFTKIEVLRANAQRSLQNIKDLFQASLKQELTPQKEWLENKLNKICEVKDGTHDSPKYVEIGIPFVTQKNITNKGFDIQNTRKITISDHDKFYKRSNVEYGDILISMIGANRGMSCIVDIKDIFSIKNVGLIKKSGNINQNYLLYYLQSPMSAEYVADASNGGAQEFIGLTALRAFPIAFPRTKEEQQTIVEKLDALSECCRAMEENYRQTLAACDELKQTLLKKAFNGEL